MSFVNFIQLGLELSSLVYISIPTWRDPFFPVFNFKSVRIPLLSKNGIFS